MAAPATIVAAGADATLAMPAVVGPPTKAPPEPARRRWGAIFATLLGLGLLAAVVVYLLVSQEDTSGQPLLDVPSVIGQPFDTGKALLEQKGFKVQSVEDETSPQPANTILSQDPSAGRRAEKGSTIVLTISSVNATVPNVVGQQFEQANTTILQAGFKVNRVDTETPDQPPGTVLSTDPVAGTKAPKAGTVNVAVAVVPGVAVPDVAGQDQNTAGKTLTAAGLNPKFTGVPSSTVGAGKVIGTNPPAGTKVQKGTDVSVQVSTGPAQVNIPNTVGLTQTDATNQLVGAGFNVTVNQVSNPANLGKVIAQNPSGGQAPPGTNITLTVGAP